MTTVSFTGITSIPTATDSWYRGLEAVSTALTTLGFPKTSDTGQVNWATVTVPSSGAYGNFEIRRFNDARQSTEPLFFKIVYTRVTISSVQYPGYQITIGTGSDGAGNLTNQIGGTYIGAFNLNTTTTDWHATSDGSGFAFFFGSQSTSFSRSILLLERLRGGDGEPLSGQVLFYKNCDTANFSMTHVKHAVIDLNSTSYAEFEGLPVMYTNSINSISSTLTSPLHTKYPFGVVSTLTSVGRGYSKLLVGYAYADFLNGTEFDITRFSDNEVCHYRCIKTENKPYHFGLVTPSSSATSNSNNVLYATPAMYWE